MSHSGSTRIPPGGTGPNGRKKGGSPLRTTTSELPEESNSPRMVQSPKSPTMRSRFAPSISSNSGCVASASAISPKRKYCRSRIGFAHSALQGATAALSRASRARRAVRMRLAAIWMPPKIRAGSQFPPGLLIEEFRISKSYGPSLSSRQRARAGAHSRMASSNFTGWSQSGSSQSGNGPFPCAAVGIRAFWRSQAPRSNLISVARIDRGSPSATRLNTTERLDTTRRPPFSDTSATDWSR